MRALVTGATGYIGGHVCRMLLAAGWEVAGTVRASSRVDHLDPRVRRLDCSDMCGVLREAEPDIVFHLAGRVAFDHGRGATEALIGDNIGFGIELLEAMAAVRCRRFIHAGTYWEYDEVGRYDPRTLYAASKHAFADLVHWYAYEHCIAAATLVLFDVYGPGDWRVKLIPELIRRVRSDGCEPLPMTAGEQLLDLVHVEDVARAFVCAADHLPPPGSRPAVWSVATGRQIALRDIIALLEQTAGRPVPAMLGARPYPHYQVMRPCTVSAMPGPPGWRAEMRIEDALPAMISEPISHSSDHERGSYS